MDKEARKEFMNYINRQLPKEKTGKTVYKPAEEQYEALKRRLGQ